MKAIALMLALSIALAATAAQAGVDPTDRASSWWDASRADRIGFSDRAAAACKSRNCDSLQIRSCLNETLKPPAAAVLRDKTLAEVTASCIASLKAKE